MQDFLISPFLPTEPYMMWVFLILAAYLIGSIPFGIFIARLFGAGDLRTQGSGNIGATNMLRVAGKKPAIITLILDALKGAVPVMLANSMMPEMAPLCGLIAAAAHMFPVWLGFKGGKGVASFLGVMMALSPVAGIITALSWLVFAFAFKYSSLSALAATVIGPFVYYFVTGLNFVPVLVLTALVWWRHRTNIRRLLDRTEPKIGDKAKK